ncbi:MAG: N-acyl homoserine lactonase family protein [Solirubrobacterales bacterium]
MPDIDAPVLSQPLPGGSAGAHVSLRPLLTGEMGAPRGFLHREDGGASKARAIGRGLSKKIETWVPCPIFLAEHPTAGYVLVDTGLPPAVAHDPRAALGRMGASIYAVRAKEDQPLPARLRSLGIEAAQIKTVVMTHLHFDHAGALSELPGATVVVSKPEWRAAHGGRALARGYIKRQYDQAYDYRLIDFEANSVNSFASFGRSFDLFGDGSVILVSTPGHTWGHLSVVLKLKDREALICGDAIYDRKTLDDSSLPLTTADDHIFRRSLREIRAYAQMTPSALVIPGHDGRAFAKLAPYYD